MTYHRAFSTGSWLLLICCLCFACGREIDNSETYNELLSKRWKVWSFTIDGVDQLATDSTTVEWLFVSDGPTSGEYEFVKTDGNSTHTDSGTYRIEKGILVLDEEYRMKGVYSVATLFLEGEFLGGEWDIWARK